MKKLSLLALALLVVSTAVFADAPEVTPSLVDLNVNKVERHGKVLKRDRFFPSESFVVGIPVVVDPGSACISLAGQETVLKPGLEVLKVKGAADPVNDICIAVMPAPIETQLTVRMNVFSQSASGRQVSKVVRIGHADYVVELDSWSESVSIHPVRRPIPVPRPIPFPRPIF